MSVYRFVIEKHQQCWSCKAEYMAELSHQFTKEQVEAPIHAGRWAWLAFLRSWILVSFEKRAVEKHHKQRRKDKGWA